MLARLAAEAVANQISDLAVDIVALQLVRPRPLHNGPHMGIVQRNVPHAIVRVVIVSAIGSCPADPHGVQIMQQEAALIIAGNKYLILRGGCLKPGNDLFIRKGAAVERDEMRPGEEEFAPYICVGHADDLFVVRQLDLEIVHDIYHAATQTLQLTLHKNDVSALQVKGVIVIRQIHIPRRKMDANDRFSRRDCGTNGALFLRGLSILFCETIKTNLEHVVSSLSDRYRSLQYPFYRRRCPINHPVRKNYPAAI